MSRIDMHAPRRTCALLNFAISKGFYISLFILSLFVSSAASANYQLPNVNTSSGPFQNCTISTLGTGETLVECSGNFIIPNSDPNEGIVLDLSATPIIWNIAGDLTFQNQFSINLGGEPNNLYINVGGNLNPGNAAVINANLSVEGSVNASQAGSEYEGDLIISGNLNLGNNASVSGNIQVDGDVNIGNQAEITGNIEASGNVNIGNGSIIDGNINADGTVNNNGTVTGYINSPSVAGGGSAGETCDQNENIGPCSGTVIPEPPSSAHFSMDICSASDPILDSIGNYTVSAFNIDREPNGQVNSAVRFDPSGASRLELESSALNGLTDFTVTLWIRPDAHNGAMELISGANNTTNAEFEFYMRANNELRAAIKGSYYAFGSPPTVTDNEWQFVAIRRSGASLCIFRNGDSSCLTATSAVLDIAVAGIGAWAQGDGSYLDSFRGAMDEVKIFNSALTNVELASIYINQKNGLAGDGSVQLDPCETVSLPPARFNFTMDICEAGDPILDVTGNYLASPVNIAPESNGQVNSAAVFASGGSSYIELENQALNGLSDFTLTMWIRPNAHNDFMSLLSASNASTNTELDFYIRDNNQLMVGIKGSYLTASFAAPPVVTNNEWQFVGLRRQGTLVCLFRNGQKECTNNASAGALNVTASAIGAWSQSNGTFQDRYRGVMDEVLLFDSGLTDTQVATIFNNQQQGFAADGTDRINPCDVILQCLVDNFSDSDALSLLWQTGVSSGSYTPSIENGRLRLNEATNDQATVASLRRAFPAANNYIEVEFEFSAYAANNFGGSVGGDGIAVVFSDAAVVPVPGSYGGSLGYAQRAGSGIDGPGFAGGWLGVGIDVYGNFSQATEGRVGGGTGGPASTRNRVALRGAAATNYAFISNSASLTGMSSSSPTPPAPDRYRIIIDSRVAATSLITVLRQRPNESDFVEVIPEFDVFQALAGQQPAVPDLLRLSFTGSTGGAFSIHEIDNLEVCALQSQPLGAVADHYRLSHSGELVSCFSETIEITACANADCSQVLLEDGSIDIQASAGTWLNTPASGPNATIPLVDGEGAANLNLTAGGIASLSFLGASPPAVSNNPLRCYIGSIFGSQAPCDVLFKTAGLAFVEPDNIDVLDNRSMVAGVPVNRAIRTVETNTTTGACEARVESQTLPVDFTYQCLNPGTCVSGQVFQLNGTPISSDATTSVPIEFNADGVGVLQNAQYSDVGEIQLTASLDIPEALPQPALTLTGNSLPFVVKPHTLRAFALNPDNSIRVQANAADPAFLEAGEAFSMIIQSQNAQGEPTPNFGQENSPVGVSVEFIETVYPVGGAPGNLTMGTSFQPFPSIPGAYRSTGLAWSEVGTFNARAQLMSNDYLGAGDAVERPPGLIGRFFPARFNLVGSMVMNTCTSYSYMDEPSVIVEYELEAWNTGEQRTLNYRPGYADLATLGLVAVQNNTDYSARINENNASSEWQEGLLTFTTSDAFFAKLAGGTVDGPFDNLTLGIEVLTERDNRNELVGGPSLAAVRPDAIQIDTPLNMLYGRLKLNNTFAPEGENLQVVAEIEYWDGQRFVRNFEDNCSMLSPNDLTVTSNPAGLNLNVGPEPTAAQVSVEQGRNPPSSLFWDGEPAQVGEFEFSYDLTELPWLRFDWQGSGLTDPSALGSFGVFRGNDRIIYILERRLN